MVTNLEDELATKLQQTGTVVAGDMAEVPVMRVIIEALEFGMVEGVEGLEAQFEFGSSCSRSGIDLNSDRFQLKSPGPTTASLPALPKP